MSSWDLRYYEDEIERDEFIEETLKNISEDGVRSYLGVHGDAVLNQYGFHRQAIISATTAIELIIRYLLIRPLVQAAFLTEDWAYFLTQRIATGRTADDRALLPKLLEYHDVKICDLKLSTGSEVWKTITEIVYGKRNRIVHAGESANLEEAKTAIECAVLFREKIVLPLAKKLGFTLETTKCWSEIKTDKMKTAYTPRSPFDA
jgi:hypothetical protein